MYPYCGTEFILDDTLSHFYLQIGIVTLILFGENLMSKGEEGKENTVKLTWIIFGTIIVGYIIFSVIRTI